MRESSCEGGQPSEILIECFARGVQRSLRLALEPTVSTPTRTPTPPNDQRQSSRSKLLVIDIPKNSEPLPWQSYLSSETVNDQHVAADPRAKIQRTANPQLPARSGQLAVSSCPLSSLSVELTTAAVIGPAGNTMT